MSAHLERAFVLLSQSRYELAEQELRQTLASDPDHPTAHALLGLCLAERERFREATEEAELAISKAPDLPFAHYALASILQDRERLKEAEAAILEAIRLDPEDADYYALLGQIHLNQRRWSVALEAAEQGLQVDAEHVDCTNLRAMALVKLGRKEEAGATIDTALAHDPENAVTHANQGWALLHQNNHKKALEHFREALRLNPELDWARQGIVESLKARNLIYGLMLRYFLWMSQLSHKAQWAVIIGGFIGYRVLRSVAETNPAVAPWIWPLLIAYIGFAVMTWIAYPLFNLLLRFNRFGRLALSREQIVASNWLALCLLAALLCLATGFLGYALMFGLLTIPVSATFLCSPGWPRKMMAGYTILLAAIGLAGPVGAVLGSRELMQSALVIFLLGAVATPWLANALMMARPKR